MVKVEALLLEMILLLADMQAPVMCREGLELVNSLVKGTVTENKINAWKARHLPQHLSDETDKERALLGRKYLTNFCHCHSNQLSAKGAVHFDSRSARKSMGAWWTLVLLLCGQMLHGG